MTPSRKKQKVDEAGTAVPTAVEVDEAFDPDRGITVKPKSKQSRTLFVRSLPPSTTNESLAEYFSQAAPLKHATAVIDRDTKECKGYGFVTFAEVEDAQKAKDELHGSTFEGKKIKIEVAEARNREVINDGPDGQRKSKPAPQAVQAKEQRTQQLHGGGDQQQGPPRLIVRNLPWSIKEADQLSKLFMSYGKVKGVKLPKGKNGTLKGFGFVLLRGRKNAEKAMAEINGKDVDGRTIAVDWAAPKDVWEKTQGAEDQSDVEATDDADQPDIALDIPDEGHEDDAEEADDTDADEDSDDDEADETELLGDDADEDDDEEELADDGNSSRTIFIRNLPFTVDDDALYQHFRTFGPLRYARVVMDYDTSEEGRSRGTGFVCFHRPEDVQACLKDAPKTQFSAANQTKDKSLVKHSLLEDTQADPTGRYTVEGRVLQLSPHVERGEAQRLAAEGTAKRNKEDKRRLYLLKEGTVSTNSPLYSTLSAPEIRAREASAKQRQDQIKKNPTLHLSLTRLAVRNIPRFLTSKDLKALARKAVVGFAADLKAEKRQPLSKEELSRGGGAMKEAEKDRRRKGKGVVKQAKIVFESREGSKVSEESGAGRSRGYGFIEYTNHRWALMGLRWLNGHLVKRPSDAENTVPAAVPVEATDGAKRLIVEFAIENAQVVQRRHDREFKTRDGPPTGDTRRGRFGVGAGAKPGERTFAKRDGKRRRDDDRAVATAKVEETPAKETSKDALRQQIVGRKRAKRRARKDAR